MFIMQTDGPTVRVELCVLCITGVCVCVLYILYYVFGHTFCTNDIIYTSRHPFSINKTCARKKTFSGDREISVSGRRDVERTDGRVYRGRPKACRDTHTRTRHVHTHTRTHTNTLTHGHVYFIQISLRNN